MNRQPMPRGNGFAVSRNLDPKLVRVESLKPLGRETRKHPPSQIRKLQASIEQFGFVLPVVIDVDSRVLRWWQNDAYNQIPLVAPLVFSIPREFPF